jgi:hypothetical protein
MLINLTNHPSDKWSQKQKQSAVEEYGFVLDMPFPQIDPHGGPEEIAQLADKYAEECRSEFEMANIPVSQAAENEAVHIMGELTFVHAFVNAAAAKNITCVASTTKRSVVEEANGQKTSVFEFVQFRAYRS